MKREKEIENAIKNVPVDEPSKYPGMSYEQGVRDALDWVTENMDDEDFEYAG